MNKILKEYLESLHEKRDIYNTIHIYKRDLIKLFNEDIGENNKKQIIDFLRRSELDNISLLQRLKYLHSIRSLLRHNLREFAEYSEEDLIQFLHFMRKYSPKTRDIRWFCIIKFFTFLGREHTFKNIKPKLKATKVKLPEELLTKEEVNELVSQAHHIRNKAFIATLYEGGFRIGELLSRQIKHVQFDRYGGVMIVDGKTGMRRVRLIESIPLLANWISNHPKNTNQNAPLWIDIITYNKPVSYNAFRRMLKKVVKQAGITKRVHMHLFRHSRATELANRLTESQLKIYLGWTTGSDMAAVYVHLSGRDVDNAILELNGVKEDKR